MDHGIPDDNCSNYRASGWEEEDANIQPPCKDCNNDDSCFVPDNYAKYTVSDFGPIPFNEQALMSELYQRGPIACTLHAQPLDPVPRGFKGVFDTKENGPTNHAIGLTGFGTDELTGMKYWIMRNSWGDYWGDGGYVKMRRGVNLLNVEEGCYYAIPKDTWTDQKNPHTGAKEQEMTVWDALMYVKESLLEQSKIDEKQAEIAAKVKQFGSIKGSYNKKKTQLLEEVIVSPQPKDYIKDDAVPQRFWWGDHDGVNYLSWTVNQHIPQYCGSCWAQGSLGAMSDRINIQNKNVPRVFLSPQVLINCAVGTCAAGGNASDVYAFAHKNGVPEYGCANYLAKDPEHADCTPIQVCEDCPPFGQGACHPVKAYVNYKAKEFGKVRGAVNMKKEIFARGPLACGIGSNNNLYFGYTGGVYSTKDEVEIDHVVVVTGWGYTEKDGEYWIIRNSWGSYWGENGYLRIKMHKDNLHIEDDCDWVVPEREIVNRP